jgi:acyl-CoA dehydrogenase
MDFALSPKSADLVDRLHTFMDERVNPAEFEYHKQMRDAGDPHFHPPILEQLKAEAKVSGLWNLFLPHQTTWTDGLSNLDYAPFTYGWPMAQTKCTAASWPNWNYVNTGTSDRADS